MRIVLVEIVIYFFVAGAAFGDVGASLFVAGATFGDVGASLFVAGAACGEILGNSTSAKCCIFQYNCLAGQGKVSSANGRVQFSWSDHSRIVFGYSRIVRVLRFVSQILVRVFVAGAILGEFGAPFLVTGPTFGDV